MGRVVNAFGIKGWLRVYPYTEKKDGLLEYETWWLGQENGHWHERQLVSGRHNGSVLEIKLSGCDDRNQALRLKGMQIAVPRNHLPSLPKNGEYGYYWSDLIGAEVINLDNQRLGTVTGLLETGANDVLCVQSEHSHTQETLIPFIERTFIKKIDLINACIIVDWGVDY